MWAGILRPGKESVRFLLPYDSSLVLGNGRRHRFAGDLGHRTEAGRAYLETAATLDALFLIYDVDQVFSPLDRAHGTPLRTDRAGLAHVRIDVV